MTMQFALSAKNLGLIYGIMVGEARMNYELTVLTVMLESPLNENTVLSTQ